MHYAPVATRGYGPGEVGLLVDFFRKIALCACMAFHTFTFEIYHSS
jgi:hypothetical protein